MHFPNDSHHFSLIQSSSILMVRKEVIDFFIPYSELTSSSLSWMAIVLVGPIVRGSRCGVSRVTSTPKIDSLV